MEVYPIGVVKHSSERQDTVTIQVYDQFLDALRGVEKREYLWIVYWMHRISEGDRKTLLVHPMGDRGKEKEGVFALRSPMRPNPIGLTRVRLIERKDNLLVVEGLDALDGSPVLDIKSG